MTQSNYQNNYIEIKKAGFTVPGLRFSRSLRQHELWGKVPLKSPHLRQTKQSAHCIVLHSPYASRRRSQCTRQPFARAYRTADTVVTLYDFSPTLRKPHQNAPDRDSESAPFILRNRGTQSPLMPKQGF